MRLHKYGMRLRGFSPGCQPKDGFVRREDVGLTDNYHDILIYGRKLSLREEVQYDLDYLGVVYDEPSGRSK